MAVARYNPDGSLDTTFGDGWLGAVLTWMARNDSASDIAVQPDGKILQSGTSRDDFALVRYNRDGSLDDTFGNEWLGAHRFLGALETNPRPSRCSRTVASLWLGMRLNSNL